MIEEPSKDRWPGIDPDAVELHRESASGWISRYSA